MRITCPKCNFEQDVPDEKIPSQAQKATCPRCKQKFQFREVEEKDGFILEEESAQAAGAESGDKSASASRKEEAEDKNLWATLEDMGDSEQTSGKPGKEEESSASPWEDLQQYGFFPGFFETVKRIMLAPSAFFSRMLPGGLGMPLGFFLLVSVIQMLATFMWNMIGIFPVTAQHGAPGMGIGMMGAGSVMILILYPIMMAAWIFVAAGITHIFLLAFQAGRAGFEGTFRATAYGSAPMLLGVLPVLGPFIGAVWSLVVTVIGYKFIHGTSFTRVILALITPVLLLALMAALMMSPR